MPITPGTPNADLNVIVRIEVGKRLDPKTWVQQGSPNTSVYALVITEGEPNAVWEKVVGGTSDPSEYTEVASIVASQALASSWFYDPATTTLYLHTSTGADPGGGSFVLMSLFWKPFGTTIMDVDGIPSEPLLDKSSIPEITSEISLMSQGGSRTSFGSVTFKNDNYFFYADLSLYEYQAKRLECWVGNAGNLFATFSRYFVGWTGDIEITDEEMSISIEDLRLYSL